MMKRFFKKGDIIVLICAAVLCLLLLLPRFFGGSSKTVAKVYENGEVTHEIELSKVSESYEIEINGGVLLVEHNAVSYIKASCPDKTCVEFGVLSRPGDTAACVPNKTVVTVSKAKSEKIDIITY